MGESTIIKPGDVQVMSAGSGIMHSEYNHSANNPLELLQIWIFPGKNNLKPRYDQKSFDLIIKNNAFITLVNPDYEKGLYIHQDAWISWLNTTKGEEITYKVRKKGNGIFVFIIEGRLAILDRTANNRDSIEIIDAEVINLIPEKHSKLIVIEIPLQF